MTIRSLVLSSWLLIGLAAAASAADYSADRFDARIEVLRGGSVRVVETVVFRFEGKTFKEVFREISTRRTDGIEIVSASMDGVPFGRGDGPGEIDVRSGSRVRVTWRFAPVSDSTHTFELTYVARGVVQRDAGGDIAAWRALPTEHRYPIASSTIEIDVPAAPAAAPAIERRRVGTLNTVVEDTHIRITAHDIKQNGWIEASMQLPAGSVVETLPRWQQRAVDARGRMPIWIAASGLIVFGGLVLLFGIRQGYDTPPSQGRSATPVSAPPDTFAPAIAGALVANGRPRLEHAMAALFKLAERGDIDISEQPKSFGQRSFVVMRKAARGRLSSYEESALETVFHSRRGTDQAVSLGTARNRLTHRFRAFSKALESDMAALGLIDDARKSVRARFLYVGVTALILAGVSAIVGAILTNAYGPGHMLLPPGFAIVGVAALVCAAVHTTLSNDGVRRREQWLAFRQHLREVTRDRATSPVERPGLLLPFAVAVGLSQQWARYLKHHREGIPTWFHAISADGSQAFAAFVATGGAGAAHGAGSAGSAGGAAGGGASGAG